MTNLTLALFLAHWPAPTDFVPTQAQLKALAWVETRNQPALRGKHHEITQFQIKRRYWNITCWGLGFDPKRPECLKMAEWSTKIWMSWNVHQFKRNYGNAIPSQELQYAMWNLGWPRCKKLGWRLNRMPSLTIRKSKEFALKVKELEESAKRK